MNRQVSNTLPWPKHIYIFLQMQLTDFFWYRLHASVGVGFCGFLLLVFFTTQSFTFNSNLSSPIQ